MWCNGCDNEYQTDEMMTRDSDDYGDIRQACGSVVESSVAYHHSKTSSKIKVFTEDNTPIAVAIIQKKY